MRTSNATIALCVITFILLLVAFVMSIMVFKVLPQHFTFGDGYIKERAIECNCFMKYSNLTATPTEPTTAKSSSVSPVTNSTPSTNKGKGKALDGNMSDRYVIMNMKCVPIPKFPVAIANDNEVMESTNRIEDYPYVVSISTYAFSDDKHDTRFLCSGTVVSNFWVFTAVNCLRDIDTLDQLEVRASSSYWSKGGSVHRVSKMSDPFQEVIALKVTPYFRFSRYLRKLEVLLTTKKFAFDTALSVGWDKKSQSYSYESKYSLFTLKKWSSFQCEEGSCKVAELNSSVKCLGPATGKPLVPDCTILAGIHTGSNCGKEGYERFSDMQTESMQNWLYSILNGDQKRRMKIPPVLNKQLLYSQPNDDTYLEICTPENLYVLASDNAQEKSTTQVWKEDVERFEERFNIGELKVGDNKDKEEEKHGQVYRRNDNEDLLAKTTIATMSSEDDQIVSAVELTTSTKFATSSVLTTIMKEEIEDTLEPALEDEEEEEDNSDVFRIKRDSVTRCGKLCKKINEEAPIKRIKMHSKSETTKSSMAKITEEQSKEDESAKSTESVYVSQKNEWNWMIDKEFYDDRFYIGELRKDDG